MNERPQCSRVFDHVHSCTAKKLFAFLSFFSFVLQLRVNARKTYPLNYPNDVTCTWIIEVPENHIVEVTFETFELEECFLLSLPVCRCGYVEVRDGKDGNSNTLEKLCGGSERYSLKSTQRYMWVKFESDSNTPRKGFNATFKASK